jgi:hypothetical protein
MSIRQPADSGKLIGVPASLIGSVILKFIPEPALENSEALNKAIETLRNAGVTYDGEVTDFPQAPTTPEPQ